VIDDGSEDDTAQIAQEFGVKLIRHECKRGAATARNSGINAAKGEIICFTDADCIPDEDWLLQIIQPLIDEPEIIGCKGAYATKQREITARFVQLEYEDKYDLLYAQDRIDFVDTYSAAFRRSVLVANGGFDERFQYAEDRELAYRLASRGYQMVFQPKAVVCHLHSRTLFQYFQKKLFIGYWVSQTLRRYPGQSIKDSHTPQVMKIQILLVALALAALLLAVLGAVMVSPWLLLLPAFILMLFLVTTLPFVRKAYAKDPVIGIVAPWMLGIRALALGLGYLLGTIRPLSGISGVEASIGGFKYVTKRTLDVFAGLFGLLLLGLAGPLIVLSIQLNSPGGILVKQECVGQSGRRFQRLRFKVSSQELGDLTPIGRFLRRWRLYRLPEFWNLLKGDLSLVGPVADDLETVTSYQDWHRRRLSVKPGMVGPVQLHLKAKELSLDERIRLELDYIENFSLRSDFIILMQAISGRSPGLGQGAD
jgi:lipopolysaccharide/colanic/teichoic acid biosynthesis glycosyltransferase/GT2 family glycosyltransferase